MKNAEERIVAEAAAWHSASAQDHMDWDGFTLWLEADPRHSTAYDEVALADLRLQELAPDMKRAPSAANDSGDDVDHGEAYVSRGNFGWRRWAGAAIAASLVAFLAIPQFIGSDPQIFETGAASRSIALADGSQVILAPHSQLQIEDGESQMALNGGAWFDIKHNPSRQLVIEAGGLQISDIGTQFDIQDAAGQVRVAVIEGVVSVKSPALAKPLSLSAGRGLTFDPTGGTALVKPVKPEAAGGWREGNLSYEAAPLALVAADLSRYAGLKVAVATPLQDKKFSGTLNIEDGEAALRDLSQLMGIDSIGSDGTYRLVSADR